MDVDDTLSAVSVVGSLAAAAAAVAADDAGSATDRGKTSCRFPDACACVNPVLSRDASSSSSLFTRHFLAGTGDGDLKTKLAAAAATVHGVLNRVEPAGPGLTHHEALEVTTAVNAALGTNAPYFTPRLLTDVEWGQDVLVNHPSRVTEPSTHTEAVVRREVLISAAEPFFSVSGNRVALLRFLLRLAQGDYPSVSDFVGADPAAAATLWLAGVPAPSSLPPPAAVSKGVVGPSKRRDDVRLRASVLQAVVAVYGVEWSNTGAVPSVVALAAGEMPPSPHVITSEKCWEFVTTTLNAFGDGVEEEE